MACVHYPLSERLQSALALPSQILASNFPNNLCARMSSKLVTPILFTINLAQQATRMKEYEQSRARICAAKLVYVHMCSSSAASSGRPWEKRSCIQSTGSGNQSKGSKRGFPVSKRRDIAGKGATCVPHKYCDSLATKVLGSLVAQPPLAGQVLAAKCQQARLAYMQVHWGWNQHTDIPYLLTAVRLLGIEFLL